MRLYRKFVTWIANEGTMADAMSLIVIMVFAGIAIVGTGLLIVVMTVSLWSSGNWPMALTVIASAMAVISVIYSVRQQLRARADRENIR